MKKNENPSKADSFIDVLNLFIYCEADYSGVLDLPSDAYIKIFEWMRPGLFTALT